MRQALGRAGGALAGVGKRQCSVLEFLQPQPGLGAVKALFKLRLSFYLQENLWLHLNCVFPTDLSSFVQPVFSHATSSDKADADQAQQTGGCDHCHIWAYFLPHFLVLLKTSLSCWNMIL